MDFSSIKGIIFDIDGTLADSWRLGFDATQSILARHNIPLITPELYHECTRYSTPERLARHAGLEPDQQHSDDFVVVGKQLAQEFDDLYVSLITMETAGFFPGVKPLLQGIPSSISLGALTNAAVRYAETVLRINGCGPSNPSNTSDNDIRCPHFASIHGADTVPLPKPAPTGLIQVCQDLDLEPHQCVYVGDSPTDGMAACAAGMPAIGVLWGSHTRESLSQAPFVCLVETVTELEQLLLGGHSRSLH